jgi:hypothetical protein
MMLLAAAGCVRETQLVPLPNAQTLAGDQETAVTEDAGVRLVADGDAWKGRPGDLERRVTPVQVRLENRSGRPLRVTYDDFTLEGQSHFRYSAIPPLSMRDSTASLEPGSGTGGSGAVAVGVGVSSGWGPYYPRYAHGGYWGWHGGWYDPFWGSPFYGPYGYYPYYYYSEPLPTRDMLNRALPEGTLEDGGVVTGFLYFQGVADRERSVTLQAQLVDANSGEPFGSLNIPFEVSKK